MFKVHSIDAFAHEIDTHHVIGQEFDNVMIMMDENFKYSEEGKLMAKEHPNPNYLFYKLLYQGLSRARKKLCILVIDNYLLFSQILKIKNNSWYEILIKWVVLVIMFLQGRIFYVTSH